MSKDNMIDSQRLTLMLNELRLPAMKQMWSDFATRSDKEGWPAARLLTALIEHELVVREQCVFAGRDKVIFPSLHACRLRPLWVAIGPQ